VAGAAAARAASGRRAVALPGVSPLTRPAARCTTCSASSAMSSSSCVMSSMGRRSCVCNSNSSWRSCSRRRRSSAAKGSSSSSAAGSLTSARASAVRWRWPPEIWCGKWSTSACRWKRAIHSSTRSFALSREADRLARAAPSNSSTRSFALSREGLRQPLLAAKAMFWRTVRCGKRA